MERPLLQHVACVLCCVLCYDAHPLPFVGILLHKAGSLIIAKVITKSKNRYLQGYMKSRSLFVRIFVHIPGLVRNKQAVRNAGRYLQEHQKSGSRYTEVSIERTVCQIGKPGLGWRICLLVDVLVLFFSLDIPEALENAYRYTSYRANKKPSNHLLRYTSMRKCYKLLDLRVFSVFVAVFLL